MCQVVVIFFPVETYIFWAMNCFGWRKNEAEVLVVMLLLTRCISPRSCDVFL